MSEPFNPQPNPPVRRRRSDAYAQPDPAPQPIQPPTYPQPTYQPPAWQQPSAQQPAPGQNAWAPYPQQYVQSAPPQPREANPQPWQQSYPQQPAYQPAPVPDPAPAAFRRSRQASPAGPRPPHATSKKKGKGLYLILLAAVILIAGAALIFLLPSGGSKVKIDPAAWAGLDGYSTTVKIAEEIDGITKKYLNENGYLPNDPGKIAQSRKVVEQFAQQLTQAGIIQGSACNQRGNTVSFFLSDGSIHLYVPPIEGVNSSAPYGVTSVDALPGYQSTVLNFFESLVVEESGGARYASEVIHKKVEEYPWHDPYFSGDSTAEKLKDVLADLDERNTRVFFWRGHGALYTDSQNREHIYFALPELINPIKHSRYQADLAENAGHCATIIVSGMSYGITDAFFQEYMPQMDGGFFFNSCCYGDLADQSMWKILQAKGWDAYCGANGSINSIYSDMMAASTAIFLCYQDENGDYFTVSQALDLAKTQQGQDDGNGIQITLHENEARAAANGPFRLVPPKTYVVGADFRLTNGFVNPIDQKNQPPEGYIPIYSYEDFRQIADACPGNTTITSRGLPLYAGNTANYILMNDITMPAEYDHAAVFAGTLDGNGHTIHNVGKSLFQSLSGATIKNLGIVVNHAYDETNATLDVHYGAISEFDLSLLYKEKNIIDNCYARGTIRLSGKTVTCGAFCGGASATRLLNCHSDVDITANARYASHIGGLAGEDASLSNCINEGNLHLSLQYEDWHLSYMGGIVGKDGAVEYSCNTGNISYSGKPVQLLAGGICGYVEGIVDTLNIHHCYNTGSIILTPDNTVARSEYQAPSGFNPHFHAGGIIGRTGDMVLISSCWNGGVISSPTTAGGIVGHRAEDAGVVDCMNQGEMKNAWYAGGIAGYSSRSPFKRCVNLGKISQSDAQGALAAYATAPSVRIGSKSTPKPLTTDCYYLQNGLSPFGGGDQAQQATALSQGDLANPGAMGMLDFATTWKILNGQPIPAM